MFTFNKIFVNIKPQTIQELAFLKICICDDDKHIHTTLKSYLHDFTKEKITSEIKDFYSAEELLDAYITEETFDIIFLDIEMGQTNGIETAEKIRQTHPKTIIVFISNYPHYVFESFKAEPLHFLVKPVSADEFTNVLNRAINKYKNLNSSITLKWENERYVVNIDSIKYIEGYMRHIAVYTDNGKYEAIGKISDMLNLLSPYDFVQTHQGFIVNMDYIQRFDKTDVVLFDNTKIMLSVRKRTEALRTFDTYLKQRKW